MNRYKIFDHQARLFGKEDVGASSITHNSSNVGQAGDWSSDGLKLDHAQLQRVRGGEVLV